MSAPVRNRGRRYGGGRSGASPGGWLLVPFAPFFRRMLDQLDARMELGALQLTLPDGSGRMLGGRAQGPAAVVELRSWRALLRLALDGSSGWYEAWAAGEWASPDPVQLFALFSANRRTLARQARASGLARLAKRAAHWLRRNSRIGARRNIEYHYDLGNDFYEAWLDPGMTYSSGLYAAPGQSLEEAQAAKLEVMLARTGTAPGDTILEIGCGWGSFAETAARAGRKVHAITLSSEQKRFAEARMARQGLDGVTISLTDYREVDDRFDAVASIEMVEAVGEEYWSAYLSAVARALKPGGRAAIQYISFDDALFAGYARNVDFIQTYIFPGGLLIHESRFRAIAERCGLRWEDRVSFGASYAETLRQWRANFDAAVAAGRLPTEFDSGFIALWRYYLMYCEGGFRGGSTDVAQVTLIKER
ncbi:class I SAM-dependent methyltransferase [Sphingosinithalassobacter sp. LHW66-3]|uniref:class I SAM-dependent methyltransferase n=1 Tax=Sphingosinithalassobacter sp. LHW66-3 TaxID=3424718 RepID=UPI003D6B44DB